MAGEPALLFGQGGGNAIYRADATASDDAGVAFDIRARSDRLYPAGLGGEALFTVLWLTVTTAITPAVPANTVDLIVTPYLDGVALEAQTFTITGPTAGAQTRLTRKYEFGLSVPYLDVYLTEQFRVGARGACFEVQVETDGGLMPGELIALGVDVEYEVVRESVAAEALA
jgi:hypothetical protein